MMGKWWEALSSSLEASHVISFLDSQAQWNIIKGDGTETKRLQLPSKTRRWKSRSLNVAVLYGLNNRKPLGVIVLLWCNQQTVHGGNEEQRVRTETFKCCCSFYQAVIDTPVRAFRVMISHNWLKKKKIRHFWICVSKKIKEKKQCNSMEVLNELKEMSLSVFLISLFLLCKSCTWTQSLNIYYYIVELCKESVYI